MTLPQIPSPTENTPPPTPAAAGGCLQPMLVIMLLGWITLLVFGRLGAQAIFSATPETVPPIQLVLLTVAQALLIGVPAAFLGFVANRSAYRPVFQTFALASLFTALLAPVYFVRPEAAQLQAALHITLALAFGALVGARRFSAAPPAADLPVDKPLPAGGRAIAAPLFAALALAALAALPWLVWGAFGSLLDSVLQLLAGLAVGGAAARLLYRVLFMPLFAGPARPTLLTLLLAGAGAAGALLIFASSLGLAYGVLQLLLSLAFPSGALIVLALYRLAPADRYRRAWLVGAVFLGLSLAAPLMLFDADELSLVINASAGEILAWAGRAALAHALGGWLLGLLGLLVMVLLAQTSSRPALKVDRRVVNLLGAAAALVAWVFAFGVYFAVGQVGFYGERLFVILQAQADVSAAVRIADIDERRAWVYSTLTDHANDTQTGLRQALDRLGLAYQPYYLVNSLEVQGGPLVAWWLNSRPEVDRVLSSPRLRPLPQPLPQAASVTNQPPQTTLWNLNQIGADRVWDEFGVRGAGVVIGQSDSGADLGHPDLTPSYRGFTAPGQPPDNSYNWFDPWFGTTTPTDWGGHGTHTLGTILGQHTGVAPEATWYGCVNLGRNLGNPALYLDCLQFMLAPFPEGGDPLQAGRPDQSADVLNNSWGCPPMEGCEAGSLLAAVQALRAAGIFTVASAGNDGPVCSSINSPLSLYDEVFSTGAIDASGRLALFSSRGPVTADGSQRIKPDLVAPGVAIFSTLPGGAYGEYSGTSMAGPHVAGVVALIWSANPDLIGDIERTEEILRQSARPYDGPLPDCPAAGDFPSSAVGYGVLDAYAAVQLALQSAGSTP